MIGQLRGLVVSKRAPWLVLDVAGVGYELEVPTSTFFELPAIGAEATLVTHFMVRQDAQSLYGFATLAERDLFRSLLRVTGVGARVALAILSGISVDGFRRCVQFDDSKSLIQLPGIGKKMAERLIVEMRDKLGEASVVDVTRIQVASAESAGAEAADALLALGYKPAEVTRLLDAIDTSSSSTEDILRQALKQAVSR
ncbi:MAG: Holliday junction branch migration protein RuvA [Pseudomonadota bacterium]